LLWPAGHFFVKYTSWCSRFSGHRLSRRPQIQGHSLLRPSPGYRACGNSLILKNLKDIIAERDCRNPYELVLRAMIANRLCASVSKLGIWDLWLSKVYIPSNETH
jgi:hypothetical protein